MADKSIKWEVCWTFKNNPTLYSDTVEATEADVSALRKTVATAFREGHPSYVNVGSTLINGVELAQISFAKKSIFGG